jgi:hypothetical protein
MRSIIAGRASTASPLVFPSSKTGGRIKRWTKLVAKLQRASGVDFRLHDLRRTVRTLMTHCRVDHDVAELAICHAREGLRRQYDFAELWDLRRARLRQGQQPRRRPARAGGSPAAGNRQGASPSLACPDTGRAAVSNQWAHHAG